LRNGVEFFPALCEAIAAARRSVHLETYIFNLDKTGHRVMDALRAASERERRVRGESVALCSYRWARDIEQLLIAMGAQYRVYRPEPTGLRNYRFSLHRLRRLHRKVTVVDGRIAFVGGINMLDDYEDVPDDGQGPRPRFDFAVRLEGPIVDDVVRAQRTLWLSMGWSRRDDLGAFYKRFAEWSKRRWPRAQSDANGFSPGRQAALLLRDNMRFRQSIENAYLRTMAHAQTDILIANAYFFPGRRLRTALEAAAARGLRVRLLLQGRSEYPMQYRACRYMYCKLLDDGIEIYEYMASYLHAKVAVIDDYAMVGSSNLDPFSLLMAREANVFVRDAGFANELKAALETEMRDDARRVTETDLQRRSAVGRAIDAVAYVLLRVGVALTGKSSEY
jgi:cardiolipin synthase